MANRMGVRLRTTLVAVAVVGLVLLAGAFLLLSFTQKRLESTITNSAVARVESVVALVESGVVGDPLPGLNQQALAQIVDAAGDIVASDQILVGVDPITDVQNKTGERTILKVPSLFEDFENEATGLEDDGPYVVVVEGVALADGVGQVMVAASLESAVEAVDATEPLLFVGLPLVLLVVGATTWLLTGRALRPVERMRQEAESISMIALDRRLPIPATRDEVHRLAVSLNEMLDGLEKSVMRQRRFVADASHELKSPLAALRTMVEVSERDLPDREVWTDLLTEIERMQRLVDDLLYLARHDETKPPAEDVEVDLDQIVLAEGAGLAQRCKVGIEKAVVPIRVKGDPNRLAQLIRNLTDNAVRHAEQTIWLETGNRDGSAVVTVSDDGPGVPPDEVERVFERFVRLDESRTRDTGGAGLGLAVARAIARNHGGDLHLIESRHGGATFELLLPLAVQTS